MTTTVAPAEPVIPGATTAFRRSAARVFSRYSGRTEIVVGGITLSLVVLSAVFSPLIAPYGPNALDLGATLQSPTGAHLMGTDDLGRDIFSRLLYGGRIDLEIAAFGTLFCFVLGSLLGLTAGFFGGLADTLIGRLVDLVISFPSIVVLIALVSVLGTSLTNIYIGITLVGWTAYARLVRGDTLSVSSRTFVTAARARGYSPARIAFRHVAPNVIGPAFIYLVTDMVLTILLVTSLSYLGLGPQPPTAEWGAMISEARPYMLQAWWMSVFPGLAIVVTGVGLGLLGDGLANVFSPSQPD